jgi:hypothetical protein
MSLIVMSNQGKHRFVFCSRHGNSAAFRIFRIRYRPQRNKEVIADDNLASQFFMLAENFRLKIGHSNPAEAMFVHKLTLYIHCNKHRNQQ